VIKISDEVLAVLENAKIEKDRIVLSDAILERSLYLATNKVIEALGGKWNLYGQCPESIRTGLWGNDDDR
jgi:hypothetical protein